MSARNSRRWLFIAAGPVVLAMAAAAGGWYIHGGKTRAVQHMFRQEFSRARTELERYRDWFGTDDAVLMSLAEAWVLDDRITAAVSARKAVELLDAIPADSTHAAKARLQSGRLRLLILHQPCHAERDLRAAIALVPDLYEANYLLWKTLDITRRYHQAEPAFRVCLDQAPPERLEEVLYDWYFSQFSTYAAAAMLDQQMGFSKRDQPSDALIEYKRLRNFEKNEPDCELLDAVLADWCHEYHVKADEDEWLEAAWKGLTTATDPWVYAVIFDLLLDDGRFEDAKAIFEAWPEPREGYDYFLRRGIYLSEVEDDPAGAIAACKQTILEWPGPVDWQVHHRLAGLLTRQGDLDQAEVYRSRAKVLEGLMEVDFHKQLRDLLIGNDRGERIRRLSKFYDDIDRPAEAGAWRTLKAN